MNNEFFKGRQLNTLYQSGVFLFAVHPCSCEYDVLITLDSTLRTKTSHIILGMSWAETEFTYRLKIPEGP